jgi:hypothetical protein
MKAFLVFAFGSVAVLFGLYEMDAAVQSGRNDRENRDLVCVYKDINYQGTEQCYGAGDEIGNLGNQSKSISSIRVYGRGTLTVFEDTAFRGHFAEFSSDVPDLGRRMMTGNTAWSDHIASLRIGGKAAVGDPGLGDRRSLGDFRGNREQPRNGICVYDRPNYEGRSQCWNRGQNVSDLARQGNWKAQIASIRLFGRTLVLVYQDTAYGGNRLTVDRDIPDLAAIHDLDSVNGRAWERGNRRMVGNWGHLIIASSSATLRRGRHCSELNSGRWKKSGRIVVHESKASKNDTRHIEGRSLPDRPSGEHHGWQDDRAAAEE